jgi:hypothetical protein
MGKNKNKKVENVVENNSVVENTIVATTEQKEISVAVTPKPVTEAVLTTIKKQVREVGTEENPTHQITVRKYFEIRMLEGATRTEIVEGLKAAVEKGIVNINARNFNCIEKNFRSQLCKTIGLLKSGGRKNSWHTQYNYSDTDGILKITLKPKTAAEEFTLTE